MIPVHLIQVLVYSTEVEDPKSIFMLLPAEILYEILTYLPVKSLARFRSVCKLWNSLISDPSFQQEHHHHRSRQDPLLLIGTPATDDYHSYRIDLSTYDINLGTSISKLTITLPPHILLCARAIQTCEGLACVDLYNQIIICNPSTREVVLLPPPHGGYSNCIGFGYIASINEFKVVRFFRRGGNHCCNIFTLGTREWREARGPPNSCSRRTFCAPFLHGAVHLLPDYKNRSADDGIGAFDIQSEEYRTIRLPECYYLEDGAASPTRYLCLYELAGSLVLAFNFKTSMELWLLRDYDNGSWMKEYTIDLPSLDSDFLWGEPVAMAGDGTVLLNVFEEENVLGQVFWYNPRDKTFASNSEENLTAATYVENLLSIGSSP